FFVNLSGASNASVADGQGQGTVVNDDAPPPSLSVTDVSQNEGNNGFTSFVFQVNLSGASSQTVTCQFATADGTATLADGEYKAASGSLTFNPGEVSKTVTVQVKGARKLEPNETFFLNLSGPTNATIADGQGQGIIGNDDTKAVTAGPFGSPS